MRKIIECKECVGRVWQYDHVFGIFTLGLGYFFQSNGDRLKADKCKKCKGNGYLIINY